MDKWLLARKMGIFAKRRVLFGTLAEQKNHLTPPQRTKELI